MKCDVSNEEQVEENFARIVETLGKVDACFANAGIGRIPQRRWGVPADFGPIAVYFAGDASAYHSGDAVVIDGGYSCF